MSSASPRRRRCPSLARAVCCCLIGWLAPAAPPSAAGPARDRGVSAPSAAPRSAPLPLAFEPNVGQTDARVAYVARGRGYALFLTGAEAVLALDQASVPGATSISRPAGREAARGGRAGAARPRRAVLRMAFGGARPDARTSGEGPLPGRVNYFAGNDPAAWRTDVPTYARVRYADLYPGVDLVYYGRDGELEYDFVVKAGADPSQIRLDLDGADEVRVGGAGDLVLCVGGEEITQHRPVLYQVDAAGARREVDGGFRLDGSGAVRFDVGAYDRSRDLVIDPILSYSTLLGGRLSRFDGEDLGRAVAVDASGAMYVGGNTSCADFPTTAGAAQTVPTGQADGFVTKLSASGSLVYSTYIGGASDDYVFDLAADSAGNAYVVGSTGSNDVATTPGVVQPAGLSSAFLAKLDAASGAFVYSTRIGGDAYTLANAVAVDGAGNAFVGGIVSAPGFPTTPGAFDTSYDSGWYNGFVVKLSPAASAYIYSTLFNGLVDGLAIDAAGAAFITGQADEQMQTTPGAYDTSYDGNYDAFAAKISQSGAALVYGTYLGGELGDYGRGIAVDPAGVAHVVGIAESPDFPTTGGAATEGNGAIDPGFVSRVSADGSSLTYSALAFPFEPTGVAVDASGASYVSGVVQGSGGMDAAVRKISASGSVAYTARVGGAEDENGAAVAVGPSGAVYLAGWTLSADFPATAGAFDAVFDGPRDAFVARLDGATGAVSYASFVGGKRSAGFDVGAAVAADASGAVYVAGRTDSLDFPVSSGALDPSLDGDFDIFVTKLAPGGGSVVYSTYLGGAFGEDVQALEVDGSGAAYVAGSTSDGFPTTAGAFDTTYNGAVDAFAAKLSPNGASLVYSTYIGGSGFDGPHGAALDASGSLYLVGAADVANFPTTPGSFDPTFNGLVDGYVTKLSPNGAALAYSTYLGGSDFDDLEDVAVDESGAAYVVGTSVSANWPVTPGAFDPTPTGAFGDMVVAKLVPSGAALGYSTFLGGSDAENPVAVAVSGAGLATVVGYTWSGDFPTTPGAYDTTFGGLDTTVTRLDAAGTGLVFSTFVSPGSVLYANAMAVDAAGVTHVAGQAYGPFPTTPDAYDRTFNGSVDAVYFQLDAAGASLPYATFLGGRSYDVASALALTPGAVFVAGTTSSTDFPTTAGAFRRRIAGAQDGFVAAFRLGACPTISVSPAALQPAAAGRPYAQQLAASGGAAPYTFAVTAGALPAGLTLSASGLLSGTAPAAGSYAFTVTATDANGCTGSRLYMLAAFAPAFNLCAADDVTGDTFRAQTSAGPGYGYYEFRVVNRPGAGDDVVYSGFASSVVATSFSVTLRDADDARQSMTASFNLRTGLARVTLLVFATAQQFTIADANSYNSSCPL